MPLPGKGLNFSAGIIKITSPCKATVLQVEFSVSIEGAKAVSPCC